MSQKNARTARTERLEYVSIPRKRWTESEKRALLSGLKRYGAEDVGKLKTLLPGKTRNSIMQMICKYRAIADFGAKEINSPLDIWLKSGIFDEDQDYLIPEALLYIFLFEDQPPVEETAGFDLKEAYRFLYEISSKRPLSSLSRTTADMMKELILTADKEIWPANDCNITDYLIGKLSTAECDKTYKRKRTE